MPVPNIFATQGGASGISLPAAQLDANFAFVLAAASAAINPTLAPYGAVGTGSQANAAANTIAFNAALLAAYNAGTTLTVPPGLYYVQEAFPGAGYCLLNEGVSVVGLGRINSILAPTAATANTVDLMKVRPRVGVYIDFVNIERMYFQMSASGTVAGRRAMYFSFDNTGINCQNLRLAYNYCSDGNDVSVWMNNSVVTNLTTTNSSTTATVASATGIVSGMTLSSANVPASATATISGTTLTLSAAATLTTPSTTITTTSGSVAATVNSGTSIAVGQSVISTNVAAGTIVASVSGTSIVLSKAATGSAGGTAVTFPSPAQFTNNAQGVPFAGKIVGGYYAEGIRIEGCADSFEFCEQPIIRSTTGSGRPGIFFDPIIGAAGCVLSGNIDADGGAITLKSGRYVVFRDIDAEQSRGSGANSACIDLDGTTAALYQPVLENVAIGNFGTAANASAIRVNRCAGADLSRVNLITASASFTANGVLVTAASADTMIGLGDISSNFTTGVNDSGVGTRGLAQTATLLNSFVNAGASYEIASYKKSREGLVTLAGFLTCPANPNGVVIMTLPSAYRPASNRHFGCWVNDGGSALSEGVDVLSNGNVVFEGTNTCTQVDLSNISFPTVQYTTTNN